VRTFLVIGSCVCGQNATEQVVYRTIAALCTLLAVDSDLRCSHYCTHYSLLRSKPRNNNNNNNVTCIAQIRQGPKCYCTVVFTGFKCKHFETKNIFKTWRLYRTTRGKFDATTTFPQYFFRRLYCIAWRMTQNRYFIQVILML